MAEVNAAGAICFLRKGAQTLFLLLRSSKHGQWGPPKGHAEPGESEIDTARRELFEEAGIQRSGFAPGFRESIVYEVEKKGRLRSKEVVFFLCELDAAQVELSHEHTEARLASMEELETLIPYADLRAVFRKALTQVNG